MLVSICDGDPSSESRRIGRDTSMSLISCQPPARRRTITTLTAEFVGDRDSGLCLGHASACYDVANRENAARRRDRLLPSYAAD